MSGHTIARRRPTFATIPRDLLRDPAISPAAKTVYALLDDYASPERPLPFPSQETLAKLLGGVTERTVRNWLTELKEAGWIEVRRRPEGAGNEYELMDRPETTFRSDRKPVSGGTGNHVPPKKSQEGEPSKENPPSPPAGGGDGRLFGDPKVEPDRKAKKARTRRGKVPEIVVARYDLWVEGYPRGSQRGSRQDGLAAFAKALEGGESTGDLEQQLAHFVAARVAYHEAWEHLGNYWPALMRVASFLNGKRTMWERPWTFEDLAYWPPPAGRSWAQAKQPGAPAAESIVERRKRMVAEERAQEQAAAKEAESRGVA